MKAAEPPEETRESSTLSARLGALAVALSRERNPLDGLPGHLRKLCHEIGFSTAAMLVLSSTEEGVAEPILAQFGPLELDIRPLLELTPIRPDYLQPPAGPGLLVAPIRFGDQLVALLVMTHQGTLTLPDGFMEGLTSYGNVVGPTIERAVLRHRLAESEKLLHARSLGEMRAVKAVETANEKRREAEGRLLHAAFHDALTGLPNRSLFMDRLSHAIRRAERHPSVVFGILCVGVDRFKVVNDSLGHGAGDQMLKSLSDRLRTAVRPSDTLARMGGDVFSILLEDIGSLRRANRVANRIHEELGRAFILDGQELFATTGIGIALSTGQREAGELLRNAELALHRAKQRGRGEMEVFDLEMHSSAMALLSLETDLRKGLDRQEFRVHYQPLYRLSDMSLSGFEALVRWQHPERGLLAPGAFLEVAEESGLIVQLGDWVLKESCRQLAQWIKQIGVSDDFSINVNVSDSQIHRPGLAAEVFQAIDDSGLDRKRISLEITENLVMEHAGKAFEVLEELNEGGLRLHLDDFGTGYSSLSYLRRLPLHSLKIDRSFVNKIDDDRQDLAVVQAIVMMAKSLGLAVTAEGIETQKQLDVIRELGCEFGQGYFFDKPLPSAQATDLINKN